MGEFVILTDSGADLEMEMLQELGVEALPLTFTIGDVTRQDWPDRREMSIEEFYRQVKEGAMPTTSAVNMHQYIEYLTPVLEGGKDALVLAFSSGLSVTCHAAKLAAEELAEKFPERKIYVVDTLAASMGQGLLVWYAARLRAEGKSIEEVRDWCEENKQYVCHWLTVDDLAHLKRGGRISATTAVVGTMLQIKPIIHVDSEGHLINVGKARGRKAALDTLVQKVGELATEPEKQTMFISQSACLEDAQYVADKIKETYGTPEVVIGNIGPVIGSHTGAGCVVLFFMGRER